MCSDQLIVEVAHVDKSFLLYDKPSHRLWQMLAGNRRTFYREHQVLKDISFQVPRGQTLGLVGRNGAGKSTLLSILCGTLTPNNGVARTYGKVAALLELGAGFNPELTGRENIDLCAQIYGLTEGQIHARRDSIIAFADIGDYIDRPVKTYSSGMFTRLGFSVVAHVDADVLIVDEALAVGDAFFVQKCMRFLHGFRDNGGTLVFVSHDMGAVTALCDRVIWLKDGRVFMDAPPKEVAGAYLADLYDQAGATDAVNSAAARDAPITAFTADEVDARLGWINTTSLRNDIEVFPFAIQHDFGSGGVVFEAGGLFDEGGRRLNWVVGGELVTLRLQLRAHVAIHSMLVGFVVKDKQGQPLFGENTQLTYLDNPLALDEQGVCTAAFTFRMPVLPSGDYAISVAVSDGTQKQHVMHQWIHDALILSSRSTSVSTGLIGIPMLDIRMDVAN